MAPHIHKYQRVKIKGKDSVGKYLFRCARPGCTHYIREEFIIGQRCICWRCEDEFVIERKQIKLKRLHCRGCTKRKNVIEVPLTIEESPI